MRSDEEIWIILKMAPSDAFEDFFRRRFAELRKADPELSKDTSEKGGFKRTIGGDGQELRASYRRGESSRHKNGMQGVTPCDCGSRTVKDCTAVQKKNQEVDAFTEMLERAGIDSGQAVFHAGAPSTRGSLIDFLNERGGRLAVPGEEQRRQQGAARGDRKGLRGAQGRRCCHSRSQQDRRPLNSKIRCISPLQHCDENNLQVKHTISVRWLYE